MSVASRWASRFWIAAVVVVGGCTNLKSCRDKPDAVHKKDEEAKMTKPQVEVEKVSPGDVCVTKGGFLAGTEPGTGSGSGAWTVREPTFRAIGLGTRGDAVSLGFHYTGAPEHTRALASGEVRRQIGLKLRAENGCNLVYVMWRLDPKPTLEVSIKVNPGMRTHEECGANGYTKIKKPSYHVAVPALLQGENHTIQAEIVDDELFAWIDGELTWRGELPKTARAMSGPSGWRSDNLGYEVTSFQAPSGKTNAEKPKCVEIEEDESD